MYFGWYPLSKPSSSWLKCRSFRSSMSTRAKALFSGAALFPGFAMSNPDVGTIHCMVPPSILSPSAKGIVANKTLSP